jgi:hypothetical protein
MIVDMASRNFSFAFAPDVVGSFEVPQERGDGDSYLLELRREAVRISTLSEDPSGERGSRSVLAEFPALFSRTLGTATCPPYDIEVSDSTPARPLTDRCAPPKITIFRKIINELLEQGVIRASRSPYASPAFLISKSGGDFRMVVDYRKVNAKVIFDSYPMPTIDQAFEQFGGAVRFSVFHLNSANYQIPLSEKSRRITAFCTPFGLFEFNKLPMGINVGCQGLSRVVDELFADLKGNDVFNFLTI